MPLCCGDSSANVALCDDLRAGPRNEPVKAVCRELFDFPVAIPAQLSYTLVMQVRVFRGRFRGLTNAPYGQERTLRFQRPAATNFDPTGSDGARRQA